MFYEAEGYTMDKFTEAQIITELPRTQLMALAYLKSIREHTIHRKFSFMGSFDGRHRSGKSITAATFGYFWDDSFWKYFEQRIVQDHMEFMDAIDNVAKLKVTGGVIIVDEAGISMASSDWYENWMKTLTKTVQMFGYLYPVVLFVAPIKDFVDSRLRKMFHAYYKVERYDNNETTITSYNLKYNAIMNKWLYKKPVIRMGGQNIRLDRIKMTKPPEFILNRYQELEQSRKKPMLAKFMEEMKRGEVKEVKKSIDLNNLTNYAVENYKIFQGKNSRPDRVALSLEQLEFGLEIPHRAAKFIKENAEKKLNERVKILTDELPKQTEEKDKRKIIETMLKQGEL